MKLLETSEVKRLILKVITGYYMIQKYLLKIPEKVRIN